MPIPARKLSALVLAERTVHRAGRTHVQKFWIRPEDAPKEESEGASLRPSSAQRLKKAPRVWRGQRVPVRTTLTNAETGGLGERIAVDFLKDHGFTDAALLHEKASTHLPLDLVADHHLYEVKCGIASSGKMSWRIMTGGEGKAEHAWMARVSPRTKERRNRMKLEAAQARKELELAKYSQKLGRNVAGKTIGIIVNPDTRTADIHVFDGFHSYIGWNGELAKSAYVGSYRYAEP
jgi:hypothetical protein